MVRPPPPRRPELSLCRRMMMTLKLVAGGGINVAVAAIHYVLAELGAAQWCRERLASAHASPRAPWRAPTLNGKTPNVNATPPTRRVDIHLAEV